MVGLGRAGILQKPKSNLDRASGFLKTYTRPYNLSNRVKSNPLGSGQARHLQIRYKLPFLEVPSPIQILVAKSM